MENLKTSNVQYCDVLVPTSPGGENFWGTRLSGVPLEQRSPNWRPWGKSSPAQTALSVLAGKT